MLMQVANLFPRWRLRNHPLYAHACSISAVQPEVSDLPNLTALQSHHASLGAAAMGAMNANAASAATGNIADDCIHIGPMRVPLAAVTSIPCPTIVAQRRTALIHASKLLEDEAVASQHKYQRTMAVLAALHADLQALRYGESSVPGGAAAAATPFAPHAPARRTPVSELRRNDGVCSARMGKRKVRHYSHALPHVMPCVMLYVMLCVCCYV